MKDATANDERKKQRLVLARSPCQKGDNSEGAAERAYNTSKKKIEERR